MNEIFNMIFVDGDILQTFIRLLILVFSLDFLLSFSNALKTIRDSVY